MSTTDRPAEWFTYFPENYRWSAAIASLLGSTAFGGPEMGEIDRVARRLRQGPPDDGRWFAEWCGLGDELRERAEAAKERGHRHSAARWYLRASAAYQVGERYRTPKDDAALSAYRTALTCFREYAGLTARPAIEPVEVPYEGTSLPGYFVAAEGTTGPAPCLVFFDGLDVTRELQYLRGVPELVERGISCLVMDGPGNGEPARFRNLPLRHDYEVVGTAVLDHLTTRPDVRQDRIGVMAVSLGGYYAVRCAAFEYRFAACVAWGAVWDYHATWAHRLSVAATAGFSMPVAHLCWVLGVSTAEEAMADLRGFRLDGVAQRMRCPFLLLHGADDQQVSIEDARALFDAVGSEDKTMVVFTPEEGGAQHVQHDYLGLATSTIFDWLEDRLKDERAR